MFEYCLAGLRAKAKTHEVTDMVAVLDADVAVVKSDAITSEDPKEELKAAVRPLENVPDQLKDWHPGFDEKVLDLVYPSSSVAALACSQPVAWPQRRCREL